MVQHPRRPVQADDHADEQEPRRHDPQRVPVRQPPREDRGRELPRRRVEGVGEPVGDEGVDGPFPVPAADGVEVWGVRQGGLEGGAGAGEGGLPLLLHLLAPTAPEKAEGTCETCGEGRWGFGRRGMLDAALPALAGSVAVEEWGFYILRGTDMATGYGGVSLSAAYGRVCFIETGV